MRIVSAFFTGLLFGLGLAISGMTQPGKVVAFLDFTGAWDPSLAFVMGGALLVFAPTFFLVRKRREKPVLEREFDLPTKTQITPRLVVGAAVFGAGWGLAGFCPGTVITSLPSGGATVLTVVAGVFLGILATWGAQSALAQQDVAVEADF
jgi:uncharacterized membrane protein YedE/YeeE